MPYATASYNPLHIFAADDIETKQTTFLGGTYAVNGGFPANLTLPALTPMKRDAATKKVVPATALTDAVIGLTFPGSLSVDGALVGPLAVRTADAEITLITEAQVFAKNSDNTVDQIYWGFYTTTPANDLEKDSVFDRTGITLKFVKPGMI